MNYRVYGLNLQSEMVFPQLPAAQDSVADVKLVFSSPRPPFDQDPRYTFIAPTAQQASSQPWLRVYHARDAYVLSYEKTGDFVVWADGREITCYPGDRGTGDYIRICTLGLVLALRFQLQNAPILHASAVVIDGQALAFVDTSGGGKSTLAAAMLRQGARLLTDDNLPLQQLAGRWQAIPGYAALRLEQESAASLLGFNGEFQRVVPESPKSWVPVPDAFCDQACPLAAIYLLDCVPAAGAPLFVRSELINARDAVLALARHSFGASWLTPTMRINQLATYANLAAAVPACFLSYSRGFANLPAVYEQIRRDLNLPSITPIPGQALPG